jgi:hypothetical protein
MAAQMDLLTGTHRSGVQFKALFIKNYLDLIHDVSSRREQRTEALKLAMGSSGLWKFESLFPDVFDGMPIVEAKPTTSVEVVDSESWSADATWDYSAVEWKSPSEHKEEYDEIMRKLAAKSSGTMNGTQITTQKKFPLMGQWR